MESLEIGARTCYEAERAYNRSHGRKDQLPWEDLSPAHKEDCINKYQTILKHLYAASQLSKQMQIWSAIAGVLHPAPTHNQD